MPKGDQIEKKKMLVDGEELEGLVNLGEYGAKDTVVEIPGQKKTVPVRNGVKIVPQIPSTYKLKRNSATLKRLEDWYYKHEFHDCVIIKTDGAGNEFARELWPNTEIGELNFPAYDASAPVFAQGSPLFLPEDIIPIDPEG